MNPPAAGPRPPQRSVPREPVTRALAFVDEVVKAFPGRSPAARPVGRPPRGFASSMRPPATRGPSRPRRSTSAPRRSSATCPSWRSCTSPRSSSCSWANRSSRRRAGGRAGRLRLSVPPLRHGLRLPVPRDDRHERLREGRARGGGEAADHRGRSSRRGAGVPLLRQVTQVVSADRRDRVRLLRHRLRGGRLHDRHGVPPAVDVRRRLPWGRSGCSPSTGSSPARSRRARGTT